MPKKYQPAGINMTPSRTELGGFIRTRRLELDLRQRTIARLAGFSQEAASAIEIGKWQYLKTKQLARLAKALQCKEKELRKRMLVKSVAEPQTELGRLIRACREELGLTLKNFAQRMGMTQEWARCIESRGGPFCQHRTVQRLAEVLDQDVSVFAKFVRDETKPTESELGQMIRARKKEFWMNGPQLAKKLGVTAQFVSQIELGVSRLSNDQMVQRLAQILRLDVNKLRAVRPKRRICQKRRTDPLGDFLTRRRLELDLTQTQVAKRAEIGKSVVGGLEAGTYNPSRLMLEKISRALECEVPADITAGIT